MGANVQPSAVAAVYDRRLRERPWLPGGVDRRHRKAKIGSLGNEEDFVGVGVAHLGAGRETAHINITLIGRVGTGDKAGLVRHRNAIGDVAPGRFDWSCGRGFR